MEYLISFTLKEMNYIDILRNKFPENIFDVFTIQMNQLRKN